MKEAPSIAETSDPVEGCVGCNQCYLTEQDAPESCPVVPAIRRVYNASGSAGKYSEMAMRILARGSQRPIAYADVMDELFDESDDTSQGALEKRVDAALRGLKTLFGKTVVWEDPAADIRTLEIDTDVVQVWCQLNPIANISKPVTENSLEPDEALLLKRKYKNVASIPGLTQLVHNYIMHDRLPDDVDESALFEQVKANIVSAFEVTGNTPLVIDSVSAAKKAVLGDGGPMRRYGRHPQASTRFHRIAYLIQGYRPPEDYIG